MILQQSLRKAMILHKCQGLRNMTCSLTFMRTLTRTYLLEQKCITRTGILTKPCTLVQPLVCVRTMKILTPERRHVTAKHKEDSVSRDYEMIYHNHMWRYYEYGRPIALFCALPIFVMDFMFVYQHFFEHADHSSELMTKAQFTLSEPALFVASGTIVLLGLLYTIHRVTSLYIPRIYHNPDTDHFIGIVQKGLFGKKQIHFTIEDVRPVKKVENALLLVLKGNVSIKGRTFLMTDDDFAELSYYNRFLGYVLEEPVKKRPLEDIRTFAKDFKRAQKK